MGNINWGIPKQLLLEFLAAKKMANFVETGTFGGATVFWAAQHFQQAYTIEIDPSISAATARKPNCPANIEFLVGNSGDLLPGLIARLTGPAVFWLDGHYSGPGTGGEHAECPIMEELQALTAAPSPVIMIDDARCFLGPLPPPHRAEHWPSLDAIFKFLHANFPSHFNTIVDDIIISLPPELKPVFDRYWRETYWQRFPPPHEPIRRFLRQIRNRFIKA